MDFDPIFVLGFCEFPYFIGAKPISPGPSPAALVLSNIHPAQMALDTDICTLVWEFISPATKLVIPRQRHRDLRPAEAERKVGIQKRLCDHWIPALAKMTGW